MIRLEFIQNIFILMGSFIFFGIINRIYGTKLPSNTVEILRFHIAGYVFYEREANQYQFRKSDLLQLKPEKTNEVAPNAIEIYFRNIKLGYIPQVYSGIISGILASNINLYAQLIELDVSKSTWERAYVGIFMDIKSLRFNKVTFNTF